MNFVELHKGKVRRKLIPRTPVNKDWQKLRLYSLPEKPCEPTSEWPNVNVRLQMPNKPLHAQEGPTKISMCNWHLPRA
jgi:hypothetical protein